MRDVRLELSPTNAGVVHPMNAVWGAAHQAELLVKIDNDTLVPPDLIRRLSNDYWVERIGGTISRSVVSTRVPA